MSLMDRFRRPSANRSNQPAAEQAPKPKRLRLEGQILPDDIFPASTTNEQ